MKPKLEGSVAAIKLVSGEEIIGRIVSEIQSQLSITKPLVFVMHPNPSLPNQAMVSFAPWMVGIRDNQVVTISMDKILFAAEARGDASDQYRQAIGDFESPHVPITNPFATDGNIPLNMNTNLKTGVSRTEPKGIDSSNVIMGKTNPRG